MELFLQELKKMRRAQYLAIAGVFLLVFGYLLFFRDFGILYTRTHTESYPQEIPLDPETKYSMELLFQDSLLEQYGSAIETYELPGFRDRYERLKEQIIRAAEEDEVFRRTGTRLEVIPVPDERTGEMREELHFSTYQAPPLEVEEEGVTGSPQPVRSDADEEYCLRCVNGQMQFPGTDAPVYFLFAMQDMLPGLEDAAQDAASDGDVLYTVMSSTLIRDLWTCLIPILLTALAALFLIVPYGILENQRGTYPLLYASRAGRRTEQRRLATMAACALGLIALGVALSAAMFASWGVERYYDAPIDGAMASVRQLETALPIAGTAHGYTGMSYLGLYLRLCVLLGAGGTILALLAGLIASRMRNIITALLAALPVALLMILFYDRYASAAFLEAYQNGLLKPWHSFLFDGEPWAVLALLAVILIAAITVHLLCARRREV